MGTAAQAKEAYIAEYRRSLSGPLPGLHSLAVDSLEFPVGRNEAWRFTSARTLLSEVHPCTYGAYGSLPDGVLGAEQLEGSPLAENIGKVAGLDGFSGLNAMLFRELAVVHARAGERSVVAIEASHTGLSTPRLLVVAEAGGQVELLLHHRVGGGLAVPVVEIVAKDGANVSLTHIVEGTAGHLAGRVAVGMGEGATVSVQSVLAGPELARLDLEATMGPSSTLHTSGIALGRGSQHLDHHLRILHSAPNSRSTQVFRTILDDRARGVFTGEVEVGRGVLGSDATQSANTLLLSDDASMVARPWLVIDNDAVTASHGATVGRLDPESLFYLRARGIGGAEASRLLTRAFAGEVVDTVPDAHREAVAAGVERWLSTRST